MRELHAVVRPDERARPRLVRDDDDAAVFAVAE
jgi:hypothetical protein